MSFLGSEKIFQNVSPNEVKQRLNENIYVSILVRFDIFMADKGSQERSRNKYW